MPMQNALGQLQEEAKDREKQVAALEHLPDIELYMDQVISLAEQRLGGFRRSDSEKTLTKAMINNYTKDQLLSPPNRKKYSRAHMSSIFKLYFLKQTLSIPDVQEVLSRQPTGDAALRPFLDLLEQSLGEVDKRAESLDPTPEALLDTIMRLSLEAYARKRMAEKLIDALKSQQPKTQPKAKAEPADK